MSRHLLNLAIVGMLSGAAKQAHSDENSNILVELNTATMSQLVNLAGIGQKRAEAIVKYRTLHPFRRVHELLQVRGIGPVLFAKLKTQVTVNPTRATVNPQP